MIISDLCDEYAVLVSQNKAPVYGYDNVNVPYGLVINDDGILVEVRLLGDFSGKKPINKISVPARFVKTSGIVPDFLCGNAEYMLGYNTEKPEHAVKAFQACAQLHMQILEGIDDPVASAVRAFFLQGPQWEIAKRLMGDCWESSLKMNFALQHVDGAQTIFVGDFPGIQKAWNTYYDQKGNDDKSSLVSSLVSGKLVVPEKTHPRIKNVAGAHPAGSALITFNAAAFCSHGAVQNENAPMSKREAYEYTTALNTLLADESRVQRIGNDTVISWACCGNAVYSDLFCVKQLMNNSRRCYRWTSMKKANTCRMCLVVYSPSTSKFNWGPYLISIRPLRINISQAHLRHRLASFRFWGISQRSICGKLGNQKDSKSSWTKFSVH